MQNFIITVDDDQVGAGELYDWIEEGGVEVRGVALVADEIMPRVKAMVTEFVIFDWETQDAEG